MDTLIKLNGIKQTYLELQANPKKTKKAQEKQRDRMMALRQDFSDVLFEGLADVEALIERHHEALCVMAMAGGPYITKGMSCKIFDFYGTRIGVSLDNHWAGTVENTCGIDNFKRLIDLNK